MFERFTDEARRATALAAAEARGLNHDFIGTEHLLLGLLSAGEGTAVTVLNELDVTLDDVREKVTQRVHPSGSGSVESPPFTPLAKKAMERSLREALKLKSDVIGSEHLLLGLVSVPDGGGARILVEMAGSLDQFREAILTRIGPRTANEPGAPLEQTKAPVTSRMLRRWATQGIGALRPPGTPPESTARPAGAAASGELSPQCPKCQAPLAREARYRHLTIPPESSVPDPGGTAGAAATESDVAADDVIESPGVAIPAGDEPPSLGVTAVYCGRCGVSLGIL